MISRNLGLMAPSNLMFYDNFSTNLPFDLEVTWKLNQWAHANPSLWAG